MWMYVIFLAAQWMFFRRFLGVFFEWVVFKIILYISVDDFHNRGWIEYLQSHH